MPKTDPDIAVSSRRVWLAVLGKHPGWNDHLDDIGLDTERLVAVKRRLYVDGIGGVINAGTWEALPEGERDEGFAHSFFWRQADGMIVGRMWSSSDGKGRKKYPMIACAMCQGLPFSFVAGPVLERLRRLEATFKEVSTAAEVIGATDRMRTELGELASFAPELNGEPVAGEGRPGSAADLIAGGALGDGGVGLKRVLYQVEREMGAFTKPDGSGTASRSRSVDVRGQHLRVPSPNGVGELGREPESIGLWCRLLLNRIDPLVPLFFAVKDGRRWVDVIVGELGPSTLSCLQAGTESYPLTSDIPFTIEGEIGATLAELIERSQRGEIRETDPCFVDVPQERLAPFLRPKRPMRPAEASSSPKKPTAIIVVAAIVIAVVVLSIVLARIFTGSGGGASPSEPGPAEVSRGVPDDEEAPSADQALIPEVTGSSPSPERLASFRAWCDSYGSFFQPFVETLDRSRVREDPSLAPGLLSAIDRAEAAGDEVDPLLATPGRFRSLSSLVESPPDDIYKDGFEKTIDRGESAIDAVRAAMFAESWETRAQLERLFERVGEAGGDGEGLIEPIVAGLEADDGESVAAAVHRTVELRPAIVAVTDQLALFERAQNDLGKLENASILDVALSLDPARGVRAETLEGWLSTVGARASEWAELASAVGQSAEKGLDRVDPELLSARMAQVGQPRGERASLAYIRAWGEAVSDPALYLLDPDTDPRRRLAGLPSVGEFRDALAALEAESPNAETAELAGMLGAYASSSDALAGVPWNEATRERVVGETTDLVSLAGTIAERIDAERRRRAVEVERYIAELRAESAISSTGSGAVDSAWVDARDRAIEIYEADGDVVRFSRAIDAARSRLAEIEDRLPIASIGAASFGDATETLRLAAAREREAFVAAAIADGEDADFSGYDEWVAELAEDERLYDRLTRAMARWLLPVDHIEGVAVGVAAASWHGSWTAARAREAEAFGRLASYTSALLASEPGVLRAMAQDKSLPAASRWVAWTRLEREDPAWLGDHANIAADASVAQELLAATETLDPEIAAPVASAIRDTATRRWLACARDASPDEFAALVPVAMRLGVDPEGLTGAIRFDWFVESLRGRVARGDELDRAGLLEELAAIAAAAADNADAASWVGSFVDELEAREGREIDYRVIGPARAGWTVEPFDGGRRLVYTWDPGGDPKRLGFRLVESPEAGVFYLSETEAPLWLMTGYALGGPYRDALLGALPDDWDPLPDTRLGPRVWTWGAFRGDRTIRRARTWVERNDTPDRPFYPEGMEDRVGRPGDNHPIQRLSAHAAVTLAAAAGCRLPTEAEWRAASAGAIDLVPGEGMNLRDETFDTQRAHTLSLGSGIAVVWPDQQSFADGMEGLPVGAAAESYPGSDGTLWFAAVDAGGTRGFNHLIGNVAEYVIGSLESGVPLGDRGTIEDAVRRASDAAGLRLRVIGGSALSPSSLPVDRGIEPATEPGKLGFTDVGFRLAFSPGVEAPLVVVVSEKLADAPFLRIVD